jgi:acetyl-CoA carboxylase carboxyl transferase subunit alpha
MDFVERLFEDFTEVHGDRRYADDAAIVGGSRGFTGMPVAVVGHQKGRDTKQRQIRNFGMPKPEGYRKALRIMKLAEKFDRPIFASSTLRELTRHRCRRTRPGGSYRVQLARDGEADSSGNCHRHRRRRSGGALAIGVGDQILMLENAIYSVISPEGCAAILWKDRPSATRRRGLKLTAQDLLNEGLVDQVIANPTAAVTSHTMTRQSCLTSLCVRSWQSPPTQRAGTTHTPLRETSSDGKMGND